jgi:hypothetical protein
MDDGGEVRIPRCHVAELADFFATHDQWLFGHACVRTRGDRELAADLVQDTFEAAARANHPVITRWLAISCKKTRANDSAPSSPTSSARTPFKNFNDRRGKQSDRWKGCDDHRCRARQPHGCWRAGEPGSCSAHGDKASHTDKSGRRDNRMRRCAPLAIVEYVRAYGGRW